MNSDNQLTYRTLLEPDFITAFINLKSIKLPLETSLKVLRAERAFLKCNQDLEEQRKALLNLYGEKNSEGELIIEEGIYKVLNKEAYSESFREIMSTPVQFEAIKISDIPSEALISAKDLEVLLATMIQF